MAKAMMVSEVGGPEVMKWQDIDVPQPGVGEVTLRHTAIGLNYIDVYFRKGLYAAGKTPFVPGLEAAGVVEVLGEDVSNLQIGDRVAYAAPPIGAYCERRNFPSEFLVKIPEVITDKQAAAMMLKGMTAEYLLKRTYPVKKGDVILVHAAAGGVGLIACQWAKHLGATVIGTVGSSKKIDIARKNGCDYPILYTDNVVRNVKEITNGRGVPVVYDSVGRATFQDSLDCLQPRGLLVCFGQSSGPIDPIDLAVLGAKGSLFLTRPTLFTYNATRDELIESASALIDVVSKKIVTVEVNQTFALSDVVVAHQALEGRRTTGSTVLLA